jgi:hypothetical protein
VKATADGRTYVTWGAEQPATKEWSAACLTECYVIITTEDEAAKVDMAELLADIEALHGTGSEAAAMPSAHAGPATLLSELAAVIRTDLYAAHQWLTDHGL